MEATHLLQEGRPGYRALGTKSWKYPQRISGKNYARLDVTFDLWKSSLMPSRIYLTWSGI